MAPHTPHFHEDLKREWKAIGDGDVEALRSGLSEDLKRELKDLDWEIASLQNFLTEEDLKRELKELCDVSLSSSNN